MKILDSSLLQQVSGAANLVITQMIPTDGISDACLCVLVQTLQNGIPSSLTEDQLNALIFASCSISELDLIFDKIDNIAPNKVDFI
jgi:hypothetical protein